ncbi:T9SS type A sorting domain-containing protein [bacterium]|nr:T9SS type A sorting domain-containing protein [bacterium]
MKSIIFSVVFYLGLSYGNCTIGVASGSVTCDGRPLAFKTRDTSSWSLEYKVQTPSGYYAYAGNTSVGSSGVWFGLSEAGFGITQSAAYNLSGGWSGLTNSSMMNYSLELCSTVDDFEDILISTNSSGRSTAANYAVFDAYGGAAIFECAPHEYARYDTDSLGIATHGNFSYIGSSGRVGQNRMDRAYLLMIEAISGDSLDATFIAKHVISDLYLTGQDPYPLPWTGIFSGLPAGWIDTGPFRETQTICNANTHAAGIAQGVAIGENPENSVLWCIFASPVSSVLFPLFPAAYDEPPEGIGSSSAMFVACKAKYDSLFSHSSIDYWLDASYLFDSLGNGVLTYVPVIIDWAYDSVSTQLSAWTSSTPSTLDRADFQDEMTSLILAAYLSGTPLNIDEIPDIPSEICLSAYPNPFNSSCLIELSSTFDEDKEIFVIDIAGRISDKILLSAGSHTAHWTPTDATPSGLYLLQISAKKLISKRVSYIK